MFRIGRISSVDYASGMARVVYADRDNSVTAEFPMLSNGEYYPLEVDDVVYVLHQDNDTSSGLILGRAWSGVNVPPEGARGVYRKDFSRSVGDGYIKYNATNDTLTIHASTKIIIEAPDGDVEINGISLLHHVHSTAYGDTGEAK